MHSHKDCKLRSYSSHGHKFWRHRHPRFRNYKPDHRSHRNYHSCSFRPFYIHSSRLYSLHYLSLYRNLSHRLWLSPVSELRCGSKLCRHSFYSFVQRKQPVHAPHNEHWRNGHLYRPGFSAHLPNGPLHNNKALVYYTERPADAGKHTAYSSWHNRGAALHFANPHCKHTVRMAHKQLWRLLKFFLSRQ